MTDKMVAAYIAQLGEPETREEAIRQRDMWVESAAQFHRDALYYMDLLDLIALSFGQPAYTADDGSVFDEPVRAKLPELVTALLREARP